MIASHPACADGDWIDWGDPLSDDQLNQGLALCYVAGSPGGWGGTQWIDLVSRRIGTLTNFNLAANGWSPSWDHSRTPFRALDFDTTSNNYVAVEENGEFDGPTNLTIAVYFAPRQVGARTKILGKGSDVGGNRALWTYEITQNTSGTMRGGFSNGSDPIDEPTTSNTVTTNKFSFFATRYNGVSGSHQSYLDGVWGTATTNQSGQLNTETGPLEIGRDPGGGDVLEAVIVHLRIYHRALSDTEIPALEHEMTTDGRRIFNRIPLDEAIVPAVSGSILSLLNHYISGYTVTGNRRSLHIGEGLNLK